MAQATYRKFHEVWTCSFQTCERRDRQTHIHTDTLIAILHTYPRGEVIISHVCILTRIKYALHV